MVSSLRRAAASGSWLGHTCVGDTPSAREEKHAPRLVRAEAGACHGLRMSRLEHGKAGARRGRRTPRSYSRVRVAWVRDVSCRPVAFVRGAIVATSMGQMRGPAPGSGTMARAVGATARVFARHRHRPRSRSSRMRRARARRRCVRRGARASQGPGPQRPKLLPHAAPFFFPPYRARGHGLPTARRLARLQFVLSGLR